MNITDSEFAVVFQVCTLMTDEVKNAQAAMDGTNDSKILQEIIDHTFYFTTWSLDRMSYEKMKLYYMFCLKSNFFKTRAYFLEEAIESFPRDGNKLN